MGCILSTWARCWLSKGKQWGGSRWACRVQTDRRSATAEVVLKSSKTSIEKARERKKAWSFKECRNDWTAQTKLLQASLCKSAWQILKLQSAAGATCYEAIENTSSVFMHAIPTQYVKYAEMKFWNILCIMYVYKYIYMCVCIVKRALKLHWSLTITKEHQASEYSERLSSICPLRPYLKRGSRPDAANLVRKKCKMRDKKNNSDETSSSSLHLVYFTNTLSTGPSTSNKKSWIQRHNPCNLLVAKLLLKMVFPQSKLTYTVKSLQQYKPNMNCSYKPV